MTMFNEGVAASGVEWSQPISLRDNTVPDSRMSCALTYYGQGTKIEVDYEVSMFEDSDYFIPASPDVINGTTISGSFTITDAGSTNPCTISGVHGLSTDDYVMLPSMGNDADWRKLKGDVFQVTSVDANSITLNGLDASGYGTYDTSVSGTANKVFHSVANLDPTDGPYIRFKVNEVAGVAADNVKLVVMVQ